MKSGEPCLQAASHRLALPVALLPMTAKETSAVGGGGGRRSAGTFPALSCEDAGLLEPTTQTPQTSKSLDGGNRVLVVVL